MARGDLKTFSQYPYNAGLGLYNNSTNSFKYALLTDEYAAVSKDLANPALASFTEATAGGNYTVGGNALANPVWDLTAGVTKLDFDNASLLKDPSNPTDAKTLLVINSTVSNQAYNLVDLTVDGTAAVDLVNNDLTVNWNANGVFNVVVS